MDGAYPRGQIARKADEEQARGPQRDAAAERRHAGGQACGVARDEQTLAQREHEESRRGDIVAAAEESHRKERRRDDDAKAVDHPEDLPQRVGGDQRAADAERGSEDQADDRDDVVASLHVTDRITGAQLYWLPNPDYGTRGCCENGGDACDASGRCVRLGRDDD